LLQEAHSAALDGAALFNTASVVSESALDADEAKHIAAFKADPAHYQNIKIVKLAPTLLDSSSLITVTTPDGKQLQFTGRKETPPAATLPFFKDGKRYDQPYPTMWAGRSDAGSFNAAYLPGGFAASFTDGGRHYHVQSLGTSNRYFVLMETPVVYGLAEPTGVDPRPNRQKPVAPASSPFTKD
jgi:hypothetical protein